jgi:hypothetical protein
VPRTPGPAVRASDSFPKPPKEKEAGNRLTNTSAPGVIHGSYPSSETAWLTSLTPRAPVQVKVAGYGRFDGVPSRADLERFFFLDDADKDLLGDRRGDHNRLGLMLQTTTVRYVGRFLEDPLDVPWPVVVPAGVRFSEMAQFSRAWPRPQGSGVS